MSMKFIGKILFAVSIILVFCYFSIKRHKDKIAELKNEIEVLKHQNDSLYSESSQKDFIIQKYDLIIHRAGNELSDECFDQLEEIMGQTE